MTEEEKKLKEKIRWEKRKEKRNEQRRLKYEKNKEIIKEQRRLKYEKNKNELNEKRRNSYDSEKRKKNYELNKEYDISYSRKYRKNNKEKINKRQREYKQNNPLFKLRCNISTNIQLCMINKGYSKKTKTYKILGCSYEDFKIHLENQFTEWMSWDNYGNPKDGLFELNKTWDIDHIIPVSVATTEEEVIKLNHYTNLQPLCSYNNRWIKKDNID